jgi:CRISPR-associated protein Cas2
MSKKNFLICYDIADEKRVGKIGKLVEKYAMRIQRSVYFYEQVSQEELTVLLEKVLLILDKEADDLRVYTIKNSGIALGEAVDLDNPLIF